MSSKEVESKEVETAGGVAASFLVSGGSSGAGGSCAVCRYERGLGRGRGRLRCIIPMKHLVCWTGRV